MHYCLERIATSGISVSTIGVELGFLPADAFQVLRSGLPHAVISDCVEVLESLRAVKTAAELNDLRQASERVVDAIAATFSRIEPGQTKQEIVEILRREEVQRELVFEYCLITAGTSLNRAPSDQRLQEGDIVSLDSGGNYHGYIGDLCRMGILGQPSPELEDALAVIEEVQQAPDGRYAAAPSAKISSRQLRRSCQHKRDGRMSFVAHGMGLVSHEAPRLLDDGPIRIQQRIVVWHF